LITETKTRQIEPDITVVEISGRLNLGNVLLTLEASIRRMIDEGARKLIIDVSTLTYIDSAGIGVLVGCRGRIAQRDGHLRIVGAQGTGGANLRTGAHEPDRSPGCGRGVCVPPFVRQRHTSLAIT
jgi:anti-anti-sigma factor